jgi:hypothetical protein
MLGEEVGAIKRLPQITRAVWFDLTAGDGIGWPDGCSPGLLVRHALNLTVDCHIRLHETDPVHYTRLLETLNEHLPRLGFMHLSPGHWYGKTRHGREIILLVIFGSGHEAVNSFIQRGDAALVLMDPNAITYWAWGATFADEIAAATKWFRSFSVMGCNPSGIQGVLSRERRDEWFSWIDDQVRALPAYPKQDLLLVRLERDAAKWGYMMRTAVAWRERTEKYVRKAFADVGAGVEISWYRLDPDHFKAIENKLFLMMKEQNL